MRFLIVLLLFGILAFLCLPFALLLILIWPILWLLSIPFRLFGMIVEAILALVRAILFLPARMLGYKG
jgi:hypothetical protein